jgi:phenylacetic acid degradation operon negative regulatory protein
MLVTLVADYWLMEGAMVPSGVLVELMADFGVTESGTRTILSRLTAAGRLESTRLGRRTVYRLSDRARRRLRPWLRTVADFGVVDPTAPVTWTALAFSVPERRRADRQKLRDGLSWLGMAPLYDGVWVTPRPVSQEARSLLGTLGIESASVFSGRIEPLGSVHGSPIDAWDIGLIRELYESYLAETEPLLEQLVRGRVEPVQALVRRTELINVWRGFPRVDPGLPLDLLPPDWPRARAHATFIRLYDGLAPAALRRVRSVVDAVDPEFTQYVAAHSIGTRTAVWPG